MFYWLFTDGYTLLQPIIWQLVCLSLLMLIITIVSFGVGIRRTSEEKQFSIWQHTLRSITYLVILMTMTSLYIFLLADDAIDYGQPANSQFIRFLVGGRGIDQMRLFSFGVVLTMLWFIGAIVIHNVIRQGGWLREHIDHLRTPQIRRGAMGSSHFCTMREYKRFRREDEDGLVLLGAFWGANKQRLDMGVGRFCLSGEDISRGLLTLGGPGSGKTQGIILPTIADRMLSGHSLIVADPQGEITKHVLKYAAYTKHLIVVHDPTSTIGPRYNLAEGIDNVSDARAIADVLIPTANGDNRFWSDSATALLAACLLRFPNLGEIYNAMNDLKSLAQQLASEKDDATLLANSFIASVSSDGKVASNVVATLATALTGWAATDVRKNTAQSDFNADMIVAQPTVVVLTCPGRMRAVYASYLGATLRKLMLDLDTIGERNHGPLPMPVGIILDEFPTLGKLDSLVADVNLVRKRRISILIGAQTKGQFHLIYGQEGTQALFTGLATQIIYGGCDAETAEFYSKASGTATTEIDTSSHLRQRPLLTVDEVITPQVGNCTIFARYVEVGFATQVILNARLTRFYERLDWEKRLQFSDWREALLLERGLSLSLEQPKQPASDMKMYEAMDNAKQAAMMLTGKGVASIEISEMRQQRHSKERRL